MKIKNLLYPMVCLGLAGLMTDRNTFAVVVPDKTSASEQSSQTDQRIKQVDEELRDIISQMKREHDARRFELQRVKNDLEAAACANTQSNPSCSGKVAWALDEDCRS